MNHHSVSTETIEVCQTFYAKCKEADCITFTQTKRICAHQHCTQRVKMPEHKEKKTYKPVHHIFKWIIWSKQIKGYPKSVEDAEIATCIWVMTLWHYTKKQHTQLPHMWQQILSHYQMTYDNCINMCWLELVYSLGINFHSYWHWLEYICFTTVTHPYCNQRRFQIDHDCKWRICIIRGAQVESFMSSEIESYHSQRKWTFCQKND